MKRLLLVLLAPLFLLGGCKYDDADVWDELEKQEARIAALEKWKETVNGNITALQGLVTALQNNDYVTGVTSFTSPAPGGYKITFTNSDEATIWNGNKGEQGVPGQTGPSGHSPVISVKKDTDNKYYWTLDGEWIKDGSGNKVVVTGEKGDTGTPGVDGKTPKVAIGGDFWYISADGTATGTPPGDGWVNTGVSAVGPVGPQGDQGDAIFAADGIDHTTSDDWVEFTLNDAGNTKIKLPKYKTIGISLDPIAPFAAGEVQFINYTSTGSEAPASIMTVAVPQGWSVEIDPDLGGESGLITITSPKDFSLHNAKANISLLLADSDNRVWLHDSGLSCGITGVQANNLGAYYFEEGVPVGVVYRTFDGDRDPLDSHGLIMHKYRLSEGVKFNAGNPGLPSEETLDDEHHGMNNFNTLKYLIPDETQWPNVWQAAITLGDEWYVPTYAELWAADEDINGSVTADINRMTIINSALSSLGITPFKKGDIFVVSDSFQIKTNGYNIRTAQYYGVYFTEVDLVDGLGEIVAQYWTYGGGFGQYSVTLKSDCIFMRDFVMP